MSGTAEALLGVIAVAIAIMAIVQVGAIIAGLRIARRVEHLATEFEAGIKPVLANLTALSTEATRTATLAAAQVERFDRVLGDLSTALQHTLAAAQRLMSGPARDGMAVVAGVRAAVSAFQTLRENSRRRTPARAATGEEEEDSLFIG